MKTFNFTQAAALAIFVVTIALTPWLSTRFKVALRSLCGSFGVACRALRLGFARVDVSVPTGSPQCVIFTHPPREPQGSLRVA